MPRFAIPVCVVLFVACDSNGGDWGGYSDDGGGNGNAADAGTTYECFSANDCTPGQYCNEFNRCIWPPTTPDAGVSDPPDPPEVEEEFGPPVSGLRYVYVALPDQDTVARIDSETLDVVTIPVGDEPRVLVAVPGQDVAVVLNQGSSTASIIRTEAGVDTTFELPTPPHFNRITVGPLGLHAVAHFELTDPNTQGIGSFQDVSIIHLAPGQERVVDVSVGFRPRQVLFSADERFAYVVTEDGVSIVDLDGADTGFIAPGVPLSPNPFVEGDPDEVLVTPDGSYAFARWASLAAVRSVDLQTGDLIDTALSAPPTDIDLTPNGEKLLAVVRPSSELTILDIPTDIGDASALQTIDASPLTIGSAVITADGSQALVFTNAINSKAMSLVDLSTGETHTALLRKGVRKVALAPDGQSALILHNKIPGDPHPSQPIEEQLDHMYGYSLMDLQTRFIKLQITAADPGAFAFTPDGAGAYVIVADPGQGLRRIESLNLINFIVSPITVGSHPTEIGAVVGTLRIYVAQEHPMGRLSFIDAITSQVQTVTGFQLNSQVIE